MDTLHTVLRSIRRESKSQPRDRSQHLEVFREFLDHLDRVSKRRSAPAPRVLKMKGKRGRR